MQLPRIPRPLIGPDPLRRVEVPRDLASVTALAPEHDPADVGMSRDAIERIWSSAERLYRSGMHPALQLCLRRRGEVVLDRAIGHARLDDRTPVSTDTPFVIFSASKAVTATVAHLLDERRLIHLEDRVSEYIPEYGTHGKDAITIDHVLSHRAGVPNLPAAVLDLDNASDREFLLKTMCEARPATRPGRLLSYHAVSGGFIIGEIVQRVTGRDIREVLAEEILDPLGFRWTNYGVAPEDVAEVGLSYVTGPPVPPPISTMLTRALGLSVDRVVEASNDPRFLEAIIPAGNIVTTAHELSRFFELLRAGGELDGVRVLEERTIRRALAEQSYLDIDLSLGFPTRFSLGFMLGAKLLSLLGRDTELAFGHLGLINIMGWADPERGVSAALITSGKAIVYPELPRFYGVMQRIASETPKLDPAEIPFRP